MQSRLKELFNKDCMYKNIEMQQETGACKMFGHTGRDLHVVECHTESYT